MTIEIKIENRFEIIQKRFVGVVFRFFLYHRVPFKENGKKVLVFKFAKFQNPTRKFCEDH